MADSGGFDPQEILRVLHDRHVLYVLIGGLAGTLYGSPHTTFDVDITPLRDADNLERLAKALDDLHARVRVAGIADGLDFDRSAAMLSRVDLLNLTTRAGDLDLAFTPAGTTGYDDLIASAVELRVSETPVVVAALADVIRSKESAGRAKDYVTLPALRALLERAAQMRARTPASQPDLPSTP